MPKSALPVDAFHDRGDPLPHPDAHRGQAVPAAGAPQAIEMLATMNAGAYVASGMGVSLISESFARNECRSGQVSLVPLEDVDLWRELGMVYDQDRTLPRAAAAFIELVRLGISRNGPVPVREHASAAEVEAIS